MPHIAEDRGIENLEYLSVIFEREIGMTPGEFRRAQRGAGATPKRYRGQFPGAMRAGGVSGRESLLNIQDKRTHCFRE